MDVAHVLQNYSVSVTLSARETTHIVHNLLVIEAIPSQDTLTSLDDFEGILILCRHPHEEISLLVADAAIAPCHALDLGELHLVDECAAVAVATIGVKVRHDGTGWYAVVRSVESEYSARRFERSSVF